MPGQGRVVERPYTSEEREAMGDAISTLGDTTFDVYLNDRAYWRNVPSNVWSYKLGGYQVLKKWLSYRESKVLGRPLKPDESTSRRWGEGLGRYWRSCPEPGSMANPWKGVWIHGADKSTLPKKLRPEREAEKRKGRCRFVIDESAEALQKSRPEQLPCHSRIIGPERIEG